MDSRIGRKYLTGGLGFGGPRSPRDNVALSYIGRALGASCELIDANDKYNRSLAPRVIEKLKPLIKPGATVAVLGLAYKPRSHVIEESAGIYIASALSDAGYRVIGYDPLAGQSARTVLSYDTLVSDSLADCLKDADAVVVTTPDDVFKSLSDRDFLQNKSAVTVVDFWRCLEKTLKGRPGVNYVPVGRCCNEEESLAAMRRSGGARRQTTSLDTAWRSLSHGTREC